MHLVAQTSKQIADQTDNTSHTMLTSILNRCLCTLLAACTSLLMAHAQAPRSAQKQPGSFDPATYADVLWLGFYGITDSLEGTTQFQLEAGNYQRVFRSAEVGLYNRCELYVRSDSAILLNLRGTINKPESWMENFYAGMIPAKGSLQLTKDYTFDYQLANDPAAMVHAGWTIGTGFLAKEYMPVLESLLERGLHQLYVVGHSQGGALAFLNTSHIFYSLASRYPQLHITTMASAAPKPGNLYYAYDLEQELGIGNVWRIVNPADWVPETPISVQGLGDLNPVNPFMFAKTAIKQQKFATRIALNYMYKSMRNGSSKAAKRYNRFLGKGVGKQVAKKLPGFVPPKYTGANNYSTAGAPVIMPTGEGYFKQFVFDGQNVFVHHMYAPYAYLLKQLRAQAE